jgi:hypothetical protein
MPRRLRPAISRPEERCFTNGVPLEVRAKENGSSVPIATPRAIRLAFQHPLVKRKSPTYIKMSITVIKVGVRAAADRDSGLLSIFPSGGTRG